MATNRVEVYTYIHKGLRNQLFQLAFQAGATDWNDTAAVEQLMVSWRNIRFMLKLHHEQEEEYFHPLLARGVPGGDKPFKADHVAQQIFLDDLQLHVQRLVDGQIPVEMRSAIGQSFYRSWNVFYSQYLAHLQREETEAQSILDTTCLPQEVATAVQTLMSHLPPEEMNLVLNNMFPALQAPEAAGLIATFGSLVPPDVFNGMTARIHQAVGDAKWAKIQAMLDTQTGTPMAPPPPATSTAGG